MTTEQAINAINTWLSPMRRSAVGSMENEFLDAVEVLERNAIKHCWHDLRKNSNDLPDSDDRMIIMYTDDEIVLERTFAWFERHSRMWEDPVRTYSNVVAWKKIEPFEDGTDAIEPFETSVIESTHVCDYCRYKEEDLDEICDDCGQYYDRFKGKRVKEA